MDFGKESDNGTFIIKIQPLVTSYRDYNETIVIIEGNRIY